MRSNSLTPQQIQNETENIEKRIVYSTESYPFNSLSLRDFEVLMYHIFDDWARNKPKDGDLFFDNAYLMPEGPDEGRDIILCKSGKDIGVIQCKRTQQNINQPQFTREIIKFALHLMMDDELDTSPEKFL